MRLIDCFLFQSVITSYDVDLFLINTAKCAIRNLVVYSTRGKSVLSAINIEVDRILWLNVSNSNLKPVELIEGDIRVIDI